MNLFDRVALSVSVGFALGIAFCSFLDFGWASIVCTGLLGVLFLFLSVPKKHHRYFLVGICLLVGSLGMLRVELEPSHLPELFVPLVETEVSLEGKIVADPDLRESTQRLTIEIRDGEAITKALVVAPLYPEVRYGETIQASGTFGLPEPFDGSGGRTFAYDKFLAKDGIFGIIPDASIKVIAPRSGVHDSVRGALSDLKFQGIEGLSAALPEPQASLAAGLILGGKQGLGETLLDDFIRSGLVHIVVLSGYNVMIVADFITRAFGFLPKGWSAGLGAISIALFVLAAGAGPASIRAGIMAAIALYGRATGRTYDAFRALLFAGVLMLLGSPRTLVFDPGFQLSFVATLGLIFGASIVEHRLAFVKSGFLREIIASTVAAQIAVLPLLLYQNGLLSFVALPANILVLPLVPLAMLASFIAMIGGLTVPFIAPVLAVPAYVLLSYIVSAVEIASHLPLAAITVPAFSFAVVVIAYALLAFLIRRSLMSQLRRSVSPQRSS